MKKACKAQIPASLYLCGSDSGKSSNRSEEVTGLGRILEGFEGRQLFYSPLWDTETQ